MLRGLIIAGAFLAACSRPAPAAAPPPAGTTRVLFVRHSAGFVHSSRDAASVALSEIASANSFSLRIVDDASVALTAESLAQTDVVVFFTSGELPIDEAQKAGLLSFLRGGGGFVGVHSATDTFYSWPEYGDIVGARFDGHPWTEDVTVRVDAPDSGIVGPLAPSFSISDEIYQFKEWRPDNAVLLSLDTSSVDLGAPGVNSQGFGFPIAWTRRFGDGRVFYLSLGHPDSTWTDPRIRSVLGRAISWAGGQ